MPKMEGRQMIMVIGSKEKEVVFVVKTRMPQGSPQEVARGIKSANRSAACKA